MSLSFWKQVTSALQGLNAQAVLAESESPFSLALVGSAPDVSAMEDWLVPPDLNPAQQAQARRQLFPMPLPLSPGDRAMLPGMTLRLASLSGTPPSSEELSGLTRDYILFAPEETATTAARLTAHRPELALALARNFPALRKPVVQSLIHRVSKENAVFAILSALPDVIPSPIELPWAIAEFASDSIIITANQMRLALMIAAACDAPVGFGEQRGQVLSIIGSAFGLRALARELAGKIPAGGGLVMKGLIAYAGTYTLGLGLVRWHRSGRGLSRLEEKQIYKQALLSGRSIIESLTRKVLPQTE